MAVESKSRGLSAVWTFSLQQLFLWTAFVALGCVALRNASDAWAAAMLGLVVLVLASAILLAIFRCEARRAFWIGFATFGGLYLLLLGYGWSLDPNTSPESPLRPYNLATTRISNVCYHWLYDAAFDKYNRAQQQMMGGMSGMMGSSGGMPMYGGGTFDGSGMMPGGSMGYASMSGGMGMPAPLGPPPGPAQHEFANVAHALWTILLAMLGGCLASWLYATKKEPPPAPSTSH
jgi:hypothetical protein